MVKTAAEAFGKVYDKLNTKENPEIFAIMQNLKGEPKHANLVSTLARYVLALTKSALSEGETIEDLLKELTPLIGAENLKQKHPDVILHCMKLICDSKNPRIMGFAKNVIREFVHILVLNIIDQTSPDVKNQPADKVNLPADQFEKGLLLLSGFIHDSFESLDRKIRLGQIHPETHPSECKLIAEQTIHDLLLRILPGGEQDFPGWLKVILGAQTLPTIEKALGTVLLKFYKSMYPTPGIPLYIDEYVHKLKAKLEPADPEKAAPLVDDAMHFCYGLADKLQKDLCKSLSEPGVDGKSELEIIEKWLQKLKPLFKDAGLPDKHPKEVLEGIKAFILSGDPRSQNVQNALKTYLAHMVFKFGVNVIIKADESGKCPKELLVANGMRYAAGLVCMSHEQLVSYYNNIRSKQGLPPDQNFPADNLEKMQLLCNVFVAEFMPDLERHFPVIPGLQKKIGKEIRSGALPELLVKQIGPLVYCQRSVKMKII